MNARVKECKKKSNVSLRKFIRGAVRVLAGVIGKEEAKLAWYPSRGNRFVRSLSHWWKVKGLAKRGPTSRTRLEKRGGGTISWAAVNDATSSVNRSQLRSNCGTKGQTPLLHVGT